MFVFVCSAADTLGKSGGGGGASFKVKLEKTKQMKCRYFTIHLIISRFRVFMAGFQR